MEAEGGGGSSRRGREEAEGVSGKYKISKKQTKQEEGKTQYKKGEGGEEDPARWQGNLNNLAGKQTNCGRQEICEAEATPLSAGG